jgi:hypothetical protein
MGNHRALYHEITYGEIYQTVAGFFSSPLSNPASLNLANLEITLSSLLTAVRFLLVPHQSINRREEDTS